MLEEYHIPQEIIDIAGQHHGTTLLKYFYYKAIKEDKEKYTEEMFRYPGSKATSKESAIVGIADSVEAVRSMNHQRQNKLIIWCKVLLKIDYKTVNLVNVI